MNLIILSSDCWTQVLLQWLPWEIFLLKKQSTKITNPYLEASLQQFYLFLLELLSTATVCLEHLFVVF